MPEMQREIRNEGVQEIQRTEPVKRRGFDLYEKVKAKFGLELGGFL